jgi:hypothetical protein
MVCLCVGVKGYTTKAAPLGVTIQAVPSLEATEAKELKQGPDPCLGALLSAASSRRY